LYASAEETANQQTNAASSVEGNNEASTVNRGFVSTPSDVSLRQRTEVSEGEMLEMHELPVEFVKNEDDLPPTYEQVTSRI
jgi:hypothetical protein